jgi:hypothetical protein
MTRLRASLLPAALPLIVTGALTGVVAAAPTASAATPPVKIYYVYYDSPGADTGSNASLNAEYVVIKNMTSSARSLTGWTLRDRANHVYKFPAFTLKAGARVWVRTGKGTATTTNRYYNSTWYIWNNTGDTAYLRDAAGTLKHSCTWGRGAVAKYC